MTTPVIVALVVALATPVVGLAVLVSTPSVDHHVDHEPSHFWLVLGAGAIAAALGWSVGVSARRRSDGRLFVVSMAFVASAAFLGLHALATPGVLLPQSNTGFNVAVPVGLVVAGALAAWSAAPLDGRRSRWIVEHATPVRAVLLALVVVWALVSLAELPPLHDPAVVATGSGPRIVLGVAATVAFTAAAWRYVVLARARRSVLLIAIAAAWVLLAESAAAASLTENWRISWWIWHVLMVAAFGAIAVAAARAPEHERFSDLYLDEVAGGTREISVVFADLQGFTSFSEANEPDEVRAMLNTYFEAVLPEVRAEGGHVDAFIGDAVMVTFNVATTQPDHAERAVRAAVGLQRAAGAVVERHPEWPRFRAGVNTGTASVGVVGDGGRRGYTVLGDTVNIASHIESQAPVGAVAITDATRRAVAGVHVSPLGTVSLKTRTEPLAIWLVEGFEPVPLTSDR